MDLNTILEVALRESRKEEVIYKTNALKCLGEILEALKIDKFEEVYNIAQSVLSQNGSTSNKDEDEDISSEEIVTKRENNIKLKEAVYEILGKAWPENNKATQEKYMEMFVEHCAACLPNNIRSVQVFVIIALRDYVDKLYLLQENNLTPKQEESLTSIVDNIIKVITYALGNLIMARF